MVNFWFLKESEFKEQRSRRIGASDIPALLPNPEKPTESLAGRWRQPDGSYYNRTAITVFNEKTGRTFPPGVGLPAEMGHWNEPKAIELFMRPIFGEEIAEEWLIKRMQYEILKKRNPELDPRQYQAGMILHSVQYYAEEFICHPDGVYEGEARIDVDYVVVDNDPTIQAHGLTIDLSRPFLVEGKSARFWSANRPAGSVVSGYDPELKTWQGIPLKHFVQIQFQLALFEIDVCYLPLLYDTSTFHVWRIDTNKKWQNKLIDLAGRVAWHIKKDIPPKELAINIDDIKELYPKINEDYVYISGEEERKALELARTANKATRQEKIWKARKDEARDALSVFLKDRGELRSAEYGSIARWIEKEGYERLTKSLKDLAKNDPVTYRYLKRKKLIKPAGSGSKYVDVTLREEE